MARFRDRGHAGRALARALSGRAYGKVVVYALPRGGVELGVAVAKALGAPLDLVIPRKIGAQDDPEYAIAAVTEDGSTVKNGAEVAKADPQWFRAEVARQAREAARRRRAYLGGRASPDVRGATAVIVDDGIATGLTMRAAISDVRRRKPAHVVVAVPVCGKDAAAIFEKEADEFVCLSPEEVLGAIGEAYDEFPQVEDAEVKKLMRAL